MTASAKIEPDSLHFRITTFQNGGVNWATVPPIVARLLAADKHGQQCER